MIVIDVDEVEGVWTPPPHNRELKILLSPEIAEVSDKLSVGMVVLQPGESGDAHMHAKEQETWYVISGRGKLRIGDEVAELKENTIVVAPAGVEHQIINDGDLDLKALFMFSPSGPELQYMGDV